MKGFSLLADGAMSAELSPGEVMLLADLGSQFRSLLEAVGERARDDSPDGFHEDEAASILGPSGWGRGASGASGAAGAGDASGAGAPGAPGAASGAEDDDADDRIFAEVPDPSNMSDDDLDPVWDDPAVRRLFPDAYPEDPEASVDFRRYTIEGSTDRKVQNVETLIASLVNGRDPEAIAATLVGSDDVVVRLSPQQVQAWIRALTDLRLTLAARLGIEEDGDEPEPTDADATAIYDIYDWLGWVQDSLVTALSEGLPA